MFQSNGNAVAGLAWASQPVLVAVETDVVADANGRDVPKTSLGQNGDFAVVVTSGDNRMFEKISGAWAEIGTSDWRRARPTTVSGSANPKTVTADSSFSLNGTVITVGADGTVPGIQALINAATIPNIQASVENFSLVIRNTAGARISLGNISGDALTVLGMTAGEYVGPRVTRTSDAQYPAGSNDGDVWVKGTKPNNGANWTVKIYDAGTQAYSLLTASFYAFDALKADTDRTKDAEARAVMGTPTSGVVYVGYDSNTGVQMLRRWNGSYFEPLAYIAAYEAPSEAPEAGTRWFNTDFRVDMMVGTGQRWVGYRNRFPDADPAGVILSGSIPVTQTDGTPLVQSDLWIDTTDKENYPALYRYDESVRRWKRVVTTDQTTPFGVVFYDARQDSGPSYAGQAEGYSNNSEKIEDLLKSDYVDPDAPDARTYPDGMMLFNTRYSNNNVKMWQPHFFEAGQFDPETDFRYHSYNVGSTVFPALDADSVGRWVTDSGLKLDGTPYMGRKAQRAVVVKAMQAAVNANQDLRSEL
ncbi:MAG: hypothetical protein EOP83_24765, partial [Verrucomicrobiaceae bacterium]